MTNGVTINWALVTDTVLLIKIVLMILIAAFFNPYKDLNVFAFLQKVAYIIKASPLKSWENLANICFAPQFPSNVLMYLRLMSPQTSESLTNQTVAKILKTGVLSFLQNLIFDQDFLDTSINLIQPAPL